MKEGFLMKLVKKGLLMVGIMSIAVGMSGCSKGDIPQSYEETQATSSSAQTTETVAPEASKESTSTTTQDTQQGPVLVMVPATGDNQIEGSEGLGFYGVYAEGQDDAAVKDAISKGHFFATQKEDGPTIKITAKDYIMGDEAPASDLVKFKVEVKGMVSGSFVKINTAEGYVVEQKVMGDTYEARIDAEDKGFYQIEVYTAAGELVAIANPITVK